VLSEQLDAGRAIYRSWSTTHPRSVSRNKAQVYWKSASFVGRCLRALHDDGDPAAGIVASETQDRQPSLPTSLYRKPGNVYATFLAGRQALRAGGGKLLDAVSRKQWFPAFQLDPPEGADIAAERFRFTPILPPGDRFWADPFPVPHGGGWAVFVEEYLYAERRGRIALLEIGSDGSWTAPRPVLEAAHHLSYPFVFRWQGETFMLPESSAGRNLVLYRASEFPHRWQPETELLDGVRVVDATLHEVDGRWWMFANLAGDETPTAHDELHLFHASSPLGPWTPHRLNPVVSDARSARPAGALFTWRGELYRPAQDCSYHYGHAVALRRVRHLGVEEYHEEPASALQPDWHPRLLATHTFNRCRGLVVVDGLRRIPGH